MTDITRIFDYQTRAIRNVERKYSGQMYDAMATTIHFEYDPINFLAYDPEYVDPETGRVGEHWIPYIMFSVKDDDGNFLVYGPDPNTSQPTFDGYTFTIPWDVTSRVEKTRRVDYQLWFVKNYVEFDPNDGVAHLASTDYVLSEVDCIVIKPSIECRKKKNPCCPATAPSSEPSVIGYINLWKEYGLVSPVGQSTDEDGKPVLKFKTYNGNKNVDVTLDVAPLDEDGKVPIKFLPTGHTNGTIPLIVGTINNNRALVYSEALGGFVDGSAITPEGSVTSAQLDIMAQNPEQYHLRPGTVYNCLDKRQYPPETGEWYRAGTNWIWETDHWEPLTGGEDLDDYQLKEYRVSAWQATPDDEHYPSEKLVKDSLDAMETELTQEIQAVDAKADANAQAIQGLEGRVEVAEGAIQGLGTRMDTAESNIADNATAIGALDTRMGTAETNIQTNAQAIQTVADTVDALSGTVAGLSDDVQSLEIAVTDLGQALDTKLDKSAVINSPAQATDTNVLSASAVTALVNAKTDKTQAIPLWDENVSYPANASVLYADSIFISVQDNNYGHDPFDSAWWTQISGQGGGGGEINIKHKTIQFGNDQDTEYALSHNMGTYDFLFSIRTNDDRRQYVLADVYATSKTTVTVKLTDPPGVNGLVLNIMEIGASSPGGTSVENITVSEPSQVWSYTNTTGRPVFVQAFQYDSMTGRYDEIRGNVDQSSSTDFNPVTDTFDAPRSGEMIIVKSDLVYRFDNSTSWIINHNLAEYVGVQCYTDQYGMVAGNVDQDGSTVVISWNEPMSGYAVLMEPKLVETIVPGTTSLTIQHDLNRFVAVQCYNGGWGQVMLDVQQNGTDTAYIQWNDPNLSGRVLII